MSNNSAATVQERSPDPRIERSTLALGRALVELIQERDFDDITVQQILDRAGVGRATFYAHYRNKEDVLHSGYERMFTAMESLLDRPSPLGARVFPVAEFVTHLADMNTLVRSLHRGGRSEEMWTLCVEYATRIIARRLPQGAVDARLPRQLAARMLAGALAEAVQWWLDHPASATPAQVDAAFHRLARNVSGAA
jgi:AcrR family transcriptional regulator